MKSIGHFVGSVKSAKLAQTKKHSILVATALQPHAVDFFKSQIYVSRHGTPICDTWGHNGSDYTKSEICLLSKGERFPCSEVNCAE